MNRRGVRVDRAINAGECQVPGASRRRGSGRRDRRLRLRLGGRGRRVAGAAARVGGAGRRGIGSQPGSAPAERRPAVSRHVPGAVRRYERLDEEGQVRLNLRATSQLVLADEATLPGTRRVAASFAAAGIPVELLERDDLLAAEPTWHPTWRAASACQGAACSTQPPQPSPWPRQPAGRCHHPHP